MDLEACLPADLRGAPIAKIAVGLSGAGVYRVGDAHVLKISDEPAETWRRKVAIAKSAEGVAPRIVHADEERRAVVSERIEDRGFFPFYATPPTHARALELLGTTIRRVHDLPIPTGVEPAAPLEVLARVWPSVRAPTFVAGAVSRLTAETPPPAGELVLSHNDLNPTNFMFDGTRIALMDWDVASANDRYYDLATVAMFLRMNADDTRALLAAYGAPDSPRFAYDRRLVAILCGVMFLHIAQQRGHTGGDASVSLAECYQRMRTGQLAVSTAEGQWTFGLALVKESL